MPESTLTLLELNKLIREELKYAFPDSYWIIAEISDLRINASGHCYLELIDKDEKHENILARNKANIWQSAFRLIKPYFESTTGRNLDPGIKILFNATVEYHEIYGFSLNIIDIDPTYTIGDLEKKRQEIIRKLVDDGIFDMNKSLPLPLVPQKIAVISSDTAAGFGDFSDQLLSNPDNYYFDLQLFPAVMQGTQAEESIILALDNIFTSTVEFDLVLIVRGGGSKSDLSCFDSYSLASNIAQFPIPVVTGIGHERDESIADMVAHTKMKTPTAAAEYLISLLSNFEKYINSVHDRIISITNNILVEHLRKIDRYSSLLNQTIKLSIERNKNHLNECRRMIVNSSRKYFSENKSRLELFSKSSSFLDPVSILKRGYSISYINGKLVKSIRNIARDDLLQTRLSDGTIKSLVQNTGKKL